MVFLCCRTSSAWDNGKSSLQVSLYWYWVLVSPTIKSLSLLISAIYTDEGIAYEIKDDEQRALAAYKQALEIDSRYLSALDRLGKLQMQRKDYNDARATYKKILEIVPDSVEA